MSKEIIRTTYAVGFLSTGLGLALMVVSLGGSLLNKVPSDAASFLVVTVIGAVISVGGLIILLAASHLKDQPAIAAGLLIITAFGSGVLGFSIIITGILGLLGVLAAFRTMRELQKGKTYSN